MFGSNIGNRISYHGEDFKSSPRQRLCPVHRLSPNYFGDLIRELTGDSATSHIRRFIMQRAQQLLMGGATISDTAESLGFDYPQHFTRQFKKHFGVTPSDFIKK